MTAVRRGISLDCEGQRHHGSVKPSRTISPMSRRCTIRFGDGHGPASWRDYLLDVLGNAETLGHRDLPAKP